jgi:hypothetical protein
MKHHRLRQVKLRGLQQIDWLFRFAAAAHNLLRVSRLIPIQAQAWAGIRVSAIRKTGSQISKTSTTHSH